MIDTIQLKKVLRIFFFGWFALCFLSIPKPVQYSDFKFFTIDVGLNSAINYLPLSIPTARDFILVGLALSAFGIGGRWLIVMNLFLSLLFISYMSHQIGLPHRFQPLWLTLAATLFVNWESPKTRDLRTFVIWARFVFTIVFFTAGLSKFVNSGMDWVNPEHFRKLLLLNMTVYPFKFMGNWYIHQMILESNFVASLMPLTVLFIELAAPLSLLNKRIAWFLIPSIFVFQFFAFYILSPLFWQYLIFYLLWIPLRHYDRLIKTGKRTSERIKTSFRRREN